MNKISRLFLVFVLTVTTVFAVSACTKKEDNQDNKTTMTEEPGIPLETYLNGNYKELGSALRFWSIYNVTLKPTKHPAKTFKAQTTGWIKYNLDNITTKNFGDLKLYKYKNFKNTEPYSDHEERRRTNILFDAAIGVWNGYEIEYSLSYYQNGKNIYTKSYHHKEPVSKKRTKFVTDILKNVKDPGTYIFHIHYITHIVGHWDAEKKITRLKDHVFAFQIGDGDDVG